MTHGPDRPLPVPTMAPDDSGAIFYQGARFTSRTMAAIFQETFISRNGDLNRPTRHQNLFSLRHNKIVRTPIRFHCRTLLTPKKSPLDFARAPPTRLSGRFQLPACWLSEFIRSNSRKFSRHSSKSEEPYFVKFLYFGFIPLIPLSGQNDAITMAGVCH